MSRNFDAWDSKFEVFARMVLQKNNFSQKMFVYEFWGCFLSFSGGLRDRFSNLCASKKCKNIWSFGVEVNPEFVICWAESTTDLGSLKA